LDVLCAKRIKWKHKTMFVHPSIHIFSSTQKFLSRFRLNLFKAFNIYSLHICLIYSLFSIHPK
jgi:hypothetical protein